MTAPSWSGETYDFYTWLTNCDTVFTVTETGPIARVQIMKQVMPEKKRKPFHSTIDWEEFKELLLSEYGSIQELGRTIQKQFAHIPQFTTRQEVADILYPKIKELISTIDCVGKYHVKSTVENVVLSDYLNQIIANSLPTELINSYSDKIAEFHDMSPRNMQPNHTFYFNAEFVRKIAKGYRANPVDYNRASNPTNMNVNAVHYTNPKPRSSPNPNYTPPPLQTHTPTATPVPTPTATPAPILTTTPAPTPTTPQPQSAHATSADTKDTTMFTSLWTNNAV